MNWLKWLGFAILCGWQASRWLLPATPDTPAPLVRLGFAYALVAVLACVLEWTRKSVRRHDDVVAQSGGWWSLAVASLMMFAVPSLLLARATEYSPETNVTVIFALVPVVVVVVWAATLSNQRGIALLLPALVGAAGVLFMLPFESPASARGWVSLAETILATILVAWACVSMHGLLRQRGCAGALIVAGSVNAVVLLAWSVLHGQLWSGWNLQAVVATGISAIVFALTVWLVAAIPPVGFAAKFMLVPLLTILEGVVLLRPEFTARLVAGVVLLLGGTAWLLSSGEAVDEEVLSLR